MTRPFFVHLPQLADKMVDGRYRMNEKHPRPDIAHDLAYLTAIVGRVAVYLALAAAGLGLAFGAAAQALMRVVEEGPALRTQGARRRGMVAAAIDGYHLAHDCFLVFYTVHINSFPCMRNCKVRDNS